MSEPTQINHQGVPTFYADQPAALQLAAHNCKLTFGAADPGEGDYPRPVVTVVMPTIALIQLVDDLRNQLGSADFKKFLQDSYQKDLKSLMAKNLQTEDDKILITPVKNPLNKKTSSTKRPGKSIP